MEPAVLNSQTTTFRRSAAAQAGGAMLAAIGGVLFLGFAVVILLGFLTEDLVMRVFAAGGFGFFGLLMAAGAVAGARQGTDTRVADIGPDGAWLPGMGRLAWSAIEEVRLERIRGVGSGDAPVTQQFRRLGFVPRDASLRPDAATSFVSQLTGLYFRAVKVVAPEIRLGGDDPAPFGVSESDIPKDFERLIELVGAFVPIADAAEARARANAARWAPPSSSVVVPPTDLAALDAALEQPSAAVASATTAPSGSGSAGALVAPLPATQPRAAFGPPPTSAVAIIFAVVPFAAPAVVVLPIVVPQVLQGGTAAIFGLLFIAVFGVGFAVPGLLRIIRLVRNARERRSDPIRLRVGPEGIWTRDGGSVAWADIREVRTERAGFDRSRSMVPIERWRLVVEPATSGQPRGTATSDELDAPFDEVLDVIRCYRPVAETS